MRSESRMQTVTSQRRLGERERATSRESVLVGDKLLQGKNEMRSFANKGFQEIRKKEM